MTTKQTAIGTAEPKAKNASKMIRRLQNIWLLLMAVGLGVTAPVALWLGLQDVVWEVSLPAQILGAFFIVAGLAASVSAVMLVVILLPFPRGRETSRHHVKYIAGGAISGIYVNLTIVLYSFRYQPVKAWLSGALALNCIFLTYLTLPAAWGAISKSVKGVGITVALLGSAANFWFVSFYLPANTQVGIEYGLSLGPMVRSGGDRLVTLDLTMDNKSSVTALTVGSMVIVRGVSYTNAGRSNTTPQERMFEYADSLAGQPADGSAAVQNPNLQFDGRQSSVVLTILRPIDDDTYLFSNDTFSHYFNVVIPEGNIVALDVEVYVQYARATRLTLSGGSRRAIRHDPSCRDEEQSAWNVDQSALVRFTHGSQMLHSIWCADPAKPSINTTVSGADSPKAEADIASNISVIDSTREEEIALH
jgi:hypothetical protein